MSGRLWILVVLSSMWVTAAAVAEQPEAIEAARQAYDREGWGGEAGPLIDGLEVEQLPHLGLIERGRRVDGQGWHLDLGRADGAPLVRLSVRCLASRLEAREALLGSLAVCSVQLERVAGPTELRFIAPGGRLQLMVEANICAQVRSLEPAGDALAGALGDALAGLLVDCPRGDAWFGPGRSGVAVMAVVTDDALPYHRVSCRLPDEPQALSMAASGAVIARVRDGSIELLVDPLADGPIHLHVVDARLRFASLPVPSTDASPPAASCLEPDGATPSLHLRTDRL